MDQRLPPATAVHVPSVAGRRRCFGSADASESVLPVRAIVDEASMQAWPGSEAYLRILDFIQTLNEAAKNHTNTEPCHESENTTKTIKLLDTLDAWIDAIPPEPALNQRFGNMAFRVWIQKLESESEQLCNDMLPDNAKNAKHEIASYLNSGFGHGTRLDYGSGHELSFVCWLCCLDLLDVFCPQDHHALVTRVFVRYLDLVRRLQMTYQLEPAGSHGVWGLDDYQFLPYLWGSAQLLDHKRIKPKTITQSDVVAHFAKEYLYLACIHHINTVKRGPFHEHSPMLYDISGVLLWAKVNSGMLKMYAAEVLHKFPVVQHLVFGSLLPFRNGDDVRPNMHE